MNKLYIMVGVPGSGKSHYAKTHFPDALRISLDDLRLMLYGKAFDADQEGVITEVSTAFVDIVLNYAHRNNRDVVYDATNVSTRRRCVLIYKARNRHMSPIAVFIDTPRMVAFQRNVARLNSVPADVLDNFIRILQPPTMTEGFDDIIVVKGEIDG
jgi:predicted kinase